MSPMSPESPTLRESPEPLLQFFTWEHLPAHLQAVSRPFGLLAEQMVTDLPRNPERTVMLRELLKAKDCAVRCKLYVSVPPGSNVVEQIGKELRKAEATDPAGGWVPSLGD